MLAIAALTLVSGAGLSAELLGLAHRTVSIPDRLVAPMFAGAERGLLVADDGSGCYRRLPSGRILSLSCEKLVENPLWWGPEELTLVQRGSGYATVRAYMGNVLLPRDAPVGVDRLLAARRGRELLLSTPHESGRFAIFRVKQDAKLSGDRQFASSKPFTAVVPDIVSESFWILSDGRVANSAGFTSQQVVLKGRGEVLAADAAERVLLAKASGRLVLFPFAAGTGEDLPALPGQLHSAMLLRDARVVACSSVAGGRSLWIWERGGAEWRPLGPYRLGGSSANGRWALVSDDGNHESWLVEFKRRAP